MARTETITVYRISPVTGPSEWRWRWKAANGKVIAASTEGYRRRTDCIGNLTWVTGGRLDLTFMARASSSGEYAQGWLIRVRALVDAVEFTERICVEVLP